MRRIFAAIATSALCVLSGQVAAQGVVADAVKGYEAVCLKTAPDFTGYRATAKQAGFQFDGTSLTLSDGAARIDVFDTEQGCACLTTLIAPNPNETVAAVLTATAASSASLSSHQNPQIAAVLKWASGENALQLESDTRGNVPLVRATLLSQTTCPRN